MGDAAAAGELLAQQPVRRADGPHDVLVKRQVLAEPDGSLADRTWAALADGTPLVTAAPLGKGWLILFHVTAETSWSNLPLSGTFVDMLRRIVAFSNSAPAGTANANASQPIAPTACSTATAASPRPAPTPSRSPATSAPSCPARPIRPAFTAARTASARSTCSTRTPTLAPFEPPAAAA